MSKYDNQNDSKTLEELLNIFLHEVIEEETISLFEEIIIEDNERESRAVEKQNFLQTVVTPQVGESILDETLFGELFLIVGECFDEIYTNHRNDLSAIRRLNDILQQTTQEMVEEVVLEIVEKKTVKSKCEKVADSIIAEVLAEEYNTISSKTLDHYRARVALLQYKQMQSTASGFILDKIVLNSMLLPHSEIDASDTGISKTNLSLLTQEKDSILNEMILDILLSQSLALHTCFPNNMPSSIPNSTVSNPQQQECIPLNWYKKKITSSIAEDVALNMLCDRLDESMQIAAEEHIKNEAVSLLVNQYLSSDN